MGIKIDIKEISLTGSKNLCDENNNIIGELRSACYSPHFQMVIGIAMVQKSHWEATQSFKIQINDNSFNGNVCDLPFI
jgi:dimethylsulfoniopropionate demethylase